MTSLEIEVKDKTKSGAVHLQVKSSGDDLGILYLSEDQYNEFVKILRAGCFNKEVDLSVVDPYNIEEEYEDEDGKDNLHSFFSID